MIREAHTRRIARDGLRDQPLVLDAERLGLLDGVGTRLRLFDRGLGDAGQIDFADAGPIERVVAGRGPQGEIGVWAHAHRTQLEAEAAAPIVSFFTLPGAGAPAEERIRVRSDARAHAAGELIVRDDRLVIVGDRGLWGGGGGIACSAAVCLERPEAAGAHRGRARWSLDETMAEVRDSLYGQNLVSGWISEADEVLHAITSGFEWWRFDARTGARLSARPLPGLERDGLWALRDPTIVRLLAAQDGGFLAEIACVARRGDRDEWTRGLVCLYDAQGHLVIRAEGTRPVAIDPAGSSMLAFVDRGLRWVVQALPGLDVEIDCLDESAENCGAVGCDPGMTWAVGVEAHPDDTLGLRSFDL
jgi:hypothetical protein